MLKEVLLKYKGPLGQLLINLSGENGEEVLRELNKFNRKEACWVEVKRAKRRTSRLRTLGKINIQEKKPILSCMGKNLALKALDGGRLICDAKSTFKSGVDNKFVTWGINKLGVASSETLVQVHDIMQDSTFMDIFSALPGTWNQKWLSQNQVIEFCETFFEWLRRNGGTTIFLVKKDESKPVDEDKPLDNLVVVCVVVYSDGLGAFYRRLSLRSIWIGEHHNRVVSPQIPKVI